MILQQGKETDPIFTAENVETALSIKEAGVMDKIVVSMGVHSDFREESRSLC